MVSHIGQSAILFLLADLSVYSVCLIVFKCTVGIIFCTLVIFCECVNVCSQYQVFSALVDPFEFIGVISTNGF